MTPTIRRLALILPVLWASGVLPLSAAPQILRTPGSPEPEASAVQPAPPPTREQVQQEWEAAQTAWMANNLKKPGWQATPSGLQYKRVIANEKGARADLNGKVTIRYTSGLITGIAENVNDPLEAPMKLLMPGMQQGLTMMRVGETWEFVIPANLAFGSQVTLHPDGSVMVPGGSIILWRVELVGVAK